MHLLKVMLMVMILMIRSMMMMLVFGLCHAQFTALFLGVTFVNEIFCLKIDICV